MDFLITSKISGGLESLPHQLELSCGYSLHTNSKDFYSDGDLKVFIYGYLLPRNSNFETLKKYNQKELVVSLYKEHGNNFLSFIKGIFCIIVSEKDSLKIFTDQLGVYRIYYANQNNGFSVSNRTDLLVKLEPTVELDTISLQLKSLFNRVPGGYTLYKNIYASKSAFGIEIKPNKNRIYQYWDYRSLIESRELNKSFSTPFFANELLQSAKNFDEFIKPQSYTITLTGGKDSRTGLALLLNQKLKPLGFTYGNPNSRDAVFAGIMAKKANLNHYTINHPQGTNYYNDTASRIVNFGNSDISLHRGHRLYAFEEISDLSQDKTAYYAGYLAGELLMGTFYDNLIFTDFLWDLMHNRKNNGESRLKHFFHKDSSIGSGLLERFSELQCINSCQTEKEKEFHSFFEIGIPHHFQDIFLSSKSMEYPVPFFLDIDFLEPLFKSSYSFFHRNNQSKNPLVRYKLFEFNIKIQHILAPELDSVFFGKRGSYNSKEFLRGKLYWSFIKSYRYLTERRSFPPTYNYDKSYIQFINNVLLQISKNPLSKLHNIFDIDAAIEKLNHIALPTTEKDLLPFTNLVHLQLLDKHINNEL